MVFPNEQLDCHPRSDGAGLEQNHEQTCAAISSMHSNELVHGHSQRRRAGYNSPIFRGISPMHGRLYLCALFIAAPTLAAQPSPYNYDRAPTDGYMYAVRYQQAKLACKALPEDLETDYAKAMLLAKAASPEFEKTYAKGLSATPRWHRPATTEEQEAQCNEAQVALRVTVKLARQWFPGGW
ncbi:hypothetical protein ACI2KO_25100 [Pseudomonas piscis]|uniref:hypothetical protein n=1 Tax=Pseudomonas TaxID=286 RepID=UPI00117A7E1C|nr:MULTISPECIES: hypothetical protein [unclassified Pseudomonas]